MQTEIIVAIIVLIQSVATAIIGGMISKASKRQKDSADKAEARAKERTEESRLSMKLQSASVSLSIANAVAIQSGNTNGALTGALQEAQLARLDYYNYVNGLASARMEER